MSSPSRGSVRMGPISLFALVIVLCLAVMAVLAVTTAQAVYTASTRQAELTQQSYQLEESGQTFLAVLDAHLNGEEDYDLSGGYVEPASLVAAGGEEGSFYDEFSATAAKELEGQEPSQRWLVDLKEDLPALAQSCAAPGMQAIAWLDEEVINVSYALESGRALNLKVEIDEEGTYRILQWKMTTLWTSKATTETLWSGA